MGSGKTASMTPADAIALMVQPIVERFHPLRVVLFGSHARGEARPDSDVDLLVVLAEVGNRREAAIATRQLLKDIPVAKDIVVASAEELVARGDIPGTVLSTAGRQGIVLHVDDQARLREVQRRLEFGREDLDAAAAVAAAGTGRPRERAACRSSRGSAAGRSAEGDDRRRGWPSPVLSRAANLRPGFRRSGVSLHA